MPMTFDTYNVCSYRCLYCFSFFQRSIGGAKESYLRNDVRFVNPEMVNAFFYQAGLIAVWALRQATIGDAVGWFI